MAENNSVEDSYNPPPVSTEFEEHIFEDLEIDDLLWLNNNSTDGMKNVVHRKIDETAAMNIKTGEMMRMANRQKVYQKT
jgi:hypothetical protein